MTTKIKQKYKGPASKINIRSNYSNKKIKISGRVGNNIKIKIKATNSNIKFNKKEKV